MNMNENETNLTTNLTNYSQDKAEIIKLYAYN